MPPPSPPLQPHPRHSAPLCQLTRPTPWACLLLGVHTVLDRYTWACCNSGKCDADELPNNGVCHELLISVVCVPPYEFSNRRGPLLISGDLMPNLRYVTSVAASPSPLSCVLHIARARSDCRDKVYFCGERAIPTQPLQTYHSSRLDSLGSGLGSHLLA
jgi:hypothetical protein